MEWAALLWREAPVMAAALAFFWLAGVAVLLVLRPSYEARARLLVQAEASAGVVSDAGPGPALLALTRHDPVRAEIAILTSQIVATEAMAEIGMKAGQQAQFRQALSARTEPDAGVIEAAFRHDDPAFAARALNAAVSAYLAYRRDAILDVETRALEAHAKDLDARLRQTEAEIERFLATNRLGDFDGERASLLALRDAQGQALAEAQAELGAARARLTALDAAIAQTPREITLFTEPDAQRRLRDLELERDALLARYTPESQTVRAADERLARARALLTQPEAAASALNRAGPNPAWQDLMLERARAAAQAKAQEARLAAIRTSLAENQRGLVQLQSLRAMHEALMRQRATLDAAARAIAGRIETQQSKADAIVPIESASPQGSALSLPAAHVWGLGGLSALLAAALGLARAAGRRGFSTAAAAERAVGLPVLAAVR
jgi:uncharacterized protein involved in exopolysaccharide biosynthesis